MNYSNRRYSAKRSNPICQGVFSATGSAELTGIFPLQDICFRIVSVNVIGCRKMHWQRNGKVYWQKKWVLRWAADLHGDGLISV
jgi:hypothetical protein